MSAPAPEDVDLQERRRVSMIDLTRHFQSDPEALRGMLDQFIRKGRVQRMRTGGACGGCQTCDPLLLEIYTWVEPAETADAPPLRSCPTGLNPLL